jgi:hypothetical protein
MMDAASQEEPNSTSSTRPAAAPGTGAGSLFRWQSAFGLVIIEVRGERVFVNGDLVEPVGLKSGAHS